MKPKLFVIEGFDQVGKDFIFDNLNVPKLRKVYEKGKCLNEVPNYKNNPESFDFYCKNYFNELVLDLQTHLENSIVVRLFNSEYVYSKLFARESNLELLNPIYENYDVVQLLFLYKSYSVFHSRDKINQYNKSQFKLIQNLYLKNPTNKKNYLNLIFYLQSNPDIELVKKIITSIL